MARRGAGQCGVHLRQGREVGVGEHETDVRGVGDDLAVGINGVGIARGADLRPADRVDDGPQVNVGDDDALARRSLGHGHDHVRPAIALTEGDASEVS